MTTYLIEQRTERRRHDQMLRRIAQPEPVRDLSFVAAVFICAAVAALVGVM